MTAVLPLVSVVVPARNEAVDIESCLRSIAAQDYPIDRVEVIVVDGDSSDETAANAERALAPTGFARSLVVANPVATTPSNLNRGLAEAEGEYLCRVDARSRIPPHYITTCVEVLGNRPEVAVVGGAQVAVPPREDAVGLGIARALNNRWAMGFSRYRRGAPSGPSDTVYLGAFRAADLRAVGGWNIDLPTNQDYDLNTRLGRHGMVWFEASIDVGYVPRRTLSDLARQYARFGRAKVRYWRLTGDRPRPRQIAPALAVVATGALAVVMGVRTPRSAVPAAGVILAAALVVEYHGGPHRAAPLSAHLVANAALATVTAAWCGGIATELLGP